MMILENNSLEERMLLDLNTFIHHKNKVFDYHMEHIKLVKRYAILLSKKLNARVDSRKLAYISLAHDTLKDRSLDPKKPDKVWRGVSIPQDLTRYVRLNLDILEEYGLDDYFNSSCQYHALAAGIFFRKEMGITDPEIIYPIMFHSCPIIPVYETLSYKIQTMIDIIMLADKLSSNYLRINMKGSPVKVDLDQVVFGPTGGEFNYSIGLYLARAIGQGKSDEEQGLAATEYYYKRLCDMNPFISESIKKLGGSTVWPARKSQVWRMH